MIHGHMSEVRRLSRVVLRRPQEAFVNQEHIDGQWRKLGYVGRPLYEQAVREYDSLAELIQSYNIVVDFLPADDNLSLDSLYVRDAAIVSPRGVILCNMGKPERKFEPGIAKKALLELDIPVYGTIEGTGQLEGGDVVWFDDETVAVGRTYRTNDEGISQFQSLVDDTVDVVVVPLPHYRGPDDVFHLMSILSPLDEDLALVYSPFLPIPFREWLLEKGIQLIEVPEREFETMGCNVLTVAPRECIMLEGNPSTRTLLKQVGVHVSEMKGSEISVKGQGGPTCLTRPLIRK